MEDPKKFRIKDFEIIKDFVVKIYFFNGKSVTIDFGPIQYKGWWEELNDLDYFNKLRINEIRNLEWPHGQDFKPEHLYYWDKYEKYYPKKVH
jgi:Protein of unknown function (DUF2442)